MSRLTYFPAIDGLRAFAVTSVLIYHLSETALPGGFTGVDIFFVISGYLITRIILKDISAEGFSILKFYQRRIARIFPALWVVSVAILTAAVFLYHKEDVSQTASTVPWAALFLANVKLIRMGGYFEVVADAQPFLHYWSLAIEEQFYVFYPVLLMLLCRWAWMRRRVSLGLLIAVATCSLLACIYYTPVMPAKAFYLLPTRAWELLAGGILAFATQEYGLRFRHPLVPLAGMVFMLGSFVFISADGFPGYMAMFPVLAGVLLLGSSAETDNFVVKFLSLPPLVFLGKISYSLYLWHWPVICFVDYELFTLPLWARLVLQLTLSLVLSILSYHLIETPLRKFFNRPEKRRASFIFFAVTTLSLVAAGLTVRHLALIKPDLSQMANGGIVINESRPIPEVVLLGDSHAAMYIPPLMKIAKDHELRLHVMSRHGSRPFPDSALWEAYTDFLKKEQAEVIVYCLVWKDRKEHFPQVADAIRSLAGKCNRLILIAQPPVIPEQGLRAGIREHGVQPVFESVDATKGRQQAHALLREIAGEFPGKIHIVDPSAYLLAEDGSVRHLSNENKHYYFDEGHLTSLGAELVRKDLAQTILPAFGKD